MRKKQDFNNNKKILKKEWFKEIYMLYEGTR